MLTAIGVTGLEPATSWPPESSGAILSLYHKKGYAYNFWKNNLLRVHICLTLSYCIWAFLSKVIRKVIRSFCYLDLTPFSVFSICKRKVTRCATICTRGTVCGVSGWKSHWLSAGGYLLQTETLCLKADMFITVRGGYSNGFKRSVFWILSRCSEFTPAWSA